MLACAPVYRFHVSRKARERYSFAAELFSTTGNVVFLDLHAVRLFTHKMNEVRAAGTARGTGGAADGAGTGGVGQAAPANVAPQAMSRSTSFHVNLTMKDLFITAPPWALDGPAR